MHFRGRPRSEVAFRHNRPDGLYQRRCDRGSTAGASTSDQDQHDDHLARNRAVHTPLRAHPLRHARTRAPRHENDYETYEDRNNTGPRTFTLIDSSPASVTFEERTPEGSLYLRYRITDAAQLGIAVGSLEELQSNTAGESLHDRIG